MNTIESFLPIFKISFKPKLDTCQKCEELINKISSADSDEQNRMLETEKASHLTEADTFYTELRDKTALAEKDMTRGFIMGLSTEFVASCIF